MHGSCDGRSCDQGMACQSVYGPKTTCLFSSKFLSYKQWDGLYTPLHVICIGVFPSVVMGEKPLILWYEPKHL